MKRTVLPRLTRACILLIVCLSITSCRLVELDTVSIKNNQEDETETGAPYTPSTQSLLRDNHWLGGVESLSLRVGSDLKADIELRDHDDPGTRFSIHNYPINFILPRLHYPPADSPDAFDAFNLMLAEFSRNSVSVPIGSKGDSMAHFRSNFTDDTPWTLGRHNYELIPNRMFNPYRFSVINNCLNPGLWELSAKDRGGELYHGWFTFPREDYYRLVAEVNHLDSDFVKRSLAWNVNDVELKLDRLRTITKSLGPSPTSLNRLVDVGYSSQGSRRKISKGYFKVMENDELVMPKKISDFLDKPVYASEFVAPGKYTYQRRRMFDFAYLAEPEKTDVMIVQPKTNYDWTMSDASTFKSPYIELHITLRDHIVVIGNLPLALLVPQEDFMMNGFGVGILTSGGLAERRAFLISDGPAPSFAYLCKRDPGKPLTAVNSHDKGLEQIFIRTHIEDSKLWWEVTLTSYERMADIVKYNIDIPEALHDQVRDYHLRYIPPVFFNYRDDNLR